MYNINSKTFTGKMRKDLSLQGLFFGKKDKTYIINNEKIINILICNKKLGHKVAVKEVGKKWEKLVNTLSELLVSDDEDGSSIQEVLNQIEKFRQIIKNKYRVYLNKKDLEKMSRQLLLFQKEAQKKYIELQNLKFFVSSKSSRR